MVDPSALLEKVLFLSIFGPVLSRVSSYKIIMSFSVSMALSSLHPLSLLHNLSPTPGFITTCSLSLENLTHTHDFNYPLYPWSICGVHMCTLKYHS